MITILEGVVSGERWEKLEEAYRDAVRKIPQDLIQTFLIRDIKDPNLWRIISVWRSKSDYEKNIESTGLYATCVDAMWVLSLPVENLILLPGTPMFKLLSYKKTQTNRQATVLLITYCAD
jgi:quinol monooxygenase YgiN